MKASKPYGPEVMEMATSRMITELTSRKEATARGNLGVERLQADFLNDKLCDGGTMAKPVDNAESFSALLEWIIKSGRGSRLDSFLIAAPAYFSDTKRIDLTKHPTVKRTIRKVKEQNPTKSIPKTTATSALLSETLKVIEEIADTPYLCARELFSTSFEAISGARVGEVFGAQVGHGVFANNLFLVTWEGGDGLIDPPAGVNIGDVFLEAQIDTSKTTVGRSFSIVGTTKGPAAVPLELYLRGLWKASDFSVNEYQEDGWKVERPDYWVVQVPLLGIIKDKGKMAKLRTWFKASESGQVRGLADLLSVELARFERVTDPKEEKMFLNVSGGPHNGPAQARAMRELRGLGFACEFTPGPLMLKTMGKTKKVKGSAEPQDSRLLPMPLLGASTYAFLHRAIGAAYKKLKEKGGEMSLGADRTVPHFAHNSWRRMADTAAQACLARGECEPEDIELHFGWNLKKHEKVMRLHYASRGARASRARITEMI